MVSKNNSLLAPDPLRWCVISSEQVRCNGHRLDASAYDIEAMNALSVVRHSPYGWVYLWGKYGLVEDAYYPGRYKRIYTSEEEGEPFFLPSQLEEIYPKPTKWISAKTANLLKNDRIVDGCLLLSRSGTIGKSSISSRATIGKIFSDDVIRVFFKDIYDLGYVYAYLNTGTGLKLLQSNNYGAVVDHIEPEHLAKVPIPNAPEEIKRRIHEAIVASYDLRDQSNDLIDEAQHLLYEALDLPENPDLKPKYYAPDAGFRCFSMSSNELNGRFDASYHLPEIKEIYSLISKQAAEVTTLGDPRISKKIKVGNRFKRVYVDKGDGAVYLNGKAIGQLDPNGLEKKYLSLKIHAQQIREQLILKENMLLITCSGTLGKVVLVPKHWDGWIGTHDLIRVFAPDTMSGYIYSYLSSSIGQKLLMRSAYGAVVDHIEPSHVTEVAIPLLKDKSLQSHINDLVLEANGLRYEAYLKEQDALSQMEKVLYSQKQ